MKIVSGEIGEEGWVRKSLNVQNHTQNTNRKKKKMQNNAGITMVATVCKFISPGCVFALNV